MVQRTRGVLKIIRKIVRRTPCQTFVIAGNTACRELTRTAKRRHRSVPGDEAIFSCAEKDLSREIATGYWEFQAA